MAHVRCSPNGIIALDFPAKSEFVIANTCVHTYVHALLLTLHIRVSSGVDALNSYLIE